MEIPLNGSRKKPLALTKELFYNHCGSFEEAGMIAIITVLACAAFMVVGALIGKGHDIAESDRKFDELRRNLIGYTNNTKDRVEGHIREEGAQVSVAIEEAMDWWWFGQKPI